MMTNYGDFSFSNENHVNKLLTGTYKVINNSITEKLVGYCENSGTTGVTMFVYQNKLITANVGDSEAGLVTFDNNKYDIKIITKNHLPTLDEERKRIEQNGGRIEPFKNEDGEYEGPLRVWQKHAQKPGLMMTRTFGDKDGHDVGMTEMPDISVTKVGNNSVGVV